MAVVLGVFSREMHAQSWEMFLVKVNFTYASSGRVWLHLFVRQAICLSFWLSVYLFIYFSVCPSVFLSVSHLSAYSCDQSVCLSSWMSDGQISVCLSDCLSGSRTVCPSVCPSECYHIYDSSKSKHSGDDRQTVRQVVACTRLFAGHLVTSHLMTLVATNLFWYWWWRRTDRQTDTSVTFDV